MRIKLFLFVFIFNGVNTFAQQDPQFTQFVFFNMSNNPGYAGTSDSLLNTTAAYRNQWVGFPGHPVTWLFCAEAPIKKLHGGLGFKFVDEKLGNFHFDHFGLSYAWHKRIKETGLLGVGIEGEFSRVDVTANWLAPDGTNGANDPAIPHENTTSYSGNFALGAYYRNKRWNVGFSSRQLLPMVYHLSSTSKYRQARHYYLTTGYNFYIGSRSRVVPSILIKSDAAVTTFDINLMAYWRKWLWTGVSYRFQDAIAPMAGVALPLGKHAIKLGYAYDLGISDLKAHHDNTHEVFLNYSLKIRKKPE